MVPDVIEDNAATGQARVSISRDETWQNLIERRHFSLNLADEFAALAAQRPDAPISIVARHRQRRSSHDYDTLSFGRCQELAGLYAQGLHRHGIGRGDTALLLIKPMLDFMPIFLALWKVGAIPVAVDPGAARVQKLNAIGEIAPRVLVGIPAAHALRVMYPRTFRSTTRTVTVGAAWFPGSPTFAQFRREPLHGPVASALTMVDDTMAIVFTSGSTGTPKGVVYTQGNGAAIIQIMKESLSLTPDDVCLACHPAFALYFVGAGATVVTPDMDPRFPRAADPACLMQIIRDQKPRVAFMQLPVIQNLQRYCAERREKIPHLRTILTTGASIPLDLVDGMHQVLGEPDADLHVMYGATEALCLAYATGREIQARADAMRDGQGTYLGRPSPWLEVSIIGVNEQPIAQWSPNLALPSGQIGEICVRGPVVTPRYWDRPDATARAKMSGASGTWHRMGDAGYVDDEGGLWYCGRIADRVATEQGDVYSDRVEPIFNQHPGVNRSALIGVPVAGAARKRPVVLIEPARADDTVDGATTQRLTAELAALARQHPNTRGLEDVRIYDGEFPVDVRHGAKIRRDQLARQVGQQTRNTTERLPADRTVLFKGHRVAYYEQGQGEAMLFLHNAGTDHYIWERQLEHFARQYRVVAADSLGYGRSDRPALDYSLPLYTEMVATLVESLSLAPVTIVAHCTGSAMALNYTLQNPEKVKRLILFHIATEATVRGGGLERITRLLSGRPALRRLLSPILEATMPRGLLQKGIIRGHYGTEFKDDAPFIAHLQGLYSKNGQARTLLNLFSNWRSFASLDTLTYPRDYPPLHVLWGDANTVLPLRQGQELCERLRPQTFDVIAAGGHLVMRERADAVNRRIMELMGLEQET